MAFDEWLLRQALCDPGLVAFRLYTWLPAAITIGLNQQADIALDWRAVGDTVVIRRATGGRALYHDSTELTYSVVLGADTTGKLCSVGSASRISALIAQGLTRFLAHHGIGAEFVRRSSPLDQRPVASHSTPCFASFARYELVAGGRKVVASAQRRIGEAVLQHGSIKIGGVAYHAALAGVGEAGGSGLRLQSIDYEWLMATACDFFSAMGEVVGSGWTLTQERAGERVSLLASQIMSAPLDRRDFH
jgi:hypothetical protein